MDLYEVIGTCDGSADQLQKIHEIIAQLEPSYDQVGTQYQGYYKTFDYTQQRFPPVYMKLKGVT